MTSYTDLTLDAALDAFEENPNAATGAALRWVAQEYCEDCMIGEAECAHILAQVARTVAP
jgi:hypothetical protein